MEMRLLFIVRMGLILLASIYSPKALELNQPNGMMILLDVNDEHAITLFESMGFAKAQGQNNLTAHWTVPEN